MVNLLLTASEQAECPIYVTLTMRSDYLGDCSEIPGLAEAVNIQFMLTEGVAGAADTRGAGGQRLSIATLMNLDLPT